MKKAYRTMILFFASAFLCGCVNCYTRWPTTDERITKVYQCSSEAAELSILCSLPQAMSDGPSRGFMLENLLTIPFFGLPCAVDAVCEAVVDTVCFPFDYFMSRHRAKKQEERYDLGTAEHD